MLLNKSFKTLPFLKIILIAVIAFVLTFLGFAIQDEVRRQAKFRTMQDSIKTTESINLTGLRDMPYTGGPPIAFSELKEKLPNKKIIIVQGMKDKHGFYKGIPTGRLGYKSKPALKHYFWRLYYTGSLLSFPEKTVPEDVEAKDHELEYTFFPIGSKFVTDDKTVDEFVRFMDNLPNDKWVFFHCNQGQGRTSIMLVMSDILKNAPQVPLNDIVKRQHLLGSENLFNTTPWVAGTYRKSMLEDRKRFVENFYAYVCQRKAGGEQVWSRWKNQQPIKQ